MGMTGWCDLLMYVPHIIIIVLSLLQLGNLHMKIRATHKTKMGISKVKKSTQIAIIQKKEKKDITREGELWIKRKLVHLLQR